MHAPTMDKLLDVASDVYLKQPVLISRMTCVLRGRRMPEENNA